MLDDDLDDETRGMARKRLRESIERVKRLEIDLAALRPKVEAANGEEGIVARTLTAAVAMGSAWRRLDDEHRRQFLGKVLQPPTGEDRRLPIACDWRAKEIVEVRLRPVWQTVAELARTRVFGSGAGNVDTRRKLGELVRFLAAGSSRTLRWSAG